MGKRNLDHSSIGIIVKYVVVKLLGGDLFKLLIRVVFPGHPEIYKTVSVGFVG